MATTATLTAEVEPAGGRAGSRAPRADGRLPRRLRGERAREGLAAGRSRAGAASPTSPRRGHRDAEAGLPVEPDTIWRIYSMTKPITSVAAMMLFEQGALRSSIRCAKFIPSFERPRSTAGDGRGARTSRRRADAVWHLLTHTSGLTYGFQQANAVDAACTARPASPRPAAGARPRLGVRPPGPRCRCSSSPARSGTTRWPPTCSACRRGRLRAAARRVLRRAHLRAARHERHRLRGPRRRRARVWPRSTSHDPETGTRRSSAPGPTRSRPSARKLLAGGARAGVDRRRLPPLHADAPAPRRARRGAAAVAAHRRLHDRATTCRATPTSTAFGPGFRRDHLRGLRLRPRRQA